MARLIGLLASPEHRQKRQADGRPGGDGGRGVEHRFQPALSTLGAGPFLVRFVATAGGHRVQRDVQFRIAADLPKT